LDWVLPLEGQTRGVPAPLSSWIGFNVLVLAVLAADMALSGRAKSPPGTGRLVLATLGWILVAVGVGAWIGTQGGPQKSLDFFTGYLIEYALSLDNILLFVLIFSSFGLTAARQRRVLSWGVVSALLMRGALILAGVALIARFSWVFYLFGAYILYAGGSFFFPKKERPVGELRAVRIARRVLPLSESDTSDRFVVHENERLRFTLLFLVLIVVEVTDLVFAFDSIPAIFGVTTDPFIVYTSNACAVLGLRSLYFLLAHAVKNLVYLQPGLGVVLVFIGAKMLLRNVVPIGTPLSLAVVAGIFGLTIVASLVHASRARQKGAHAHPR
jgi:tellurite resistance protein TerC